jgi:hypothetical protein
MIVIYAKRAMIDNKQEDVMGLVKRLDLEVARRDAYWDMQRAWDRQAAETVEEGFSIEHNEELLRAAKDAQERYYRACKELEDYLKNR